MDKLWLKNEFSDNEFCPIKRFEEKEKGIIFYPEITKSELRSDTANNDTNYYNGRVDVIATTYLGSANGGSETAWFVMAAPGMAENAVAMRHVSLIEPKIEQDDDFDTKSIKISVDGACAFGYSNFEYAQGSTGEEA